MREQKKLTVREIPPKLQDKIRRIFDNGQPTGSKRTSREEEEELKGIEQELMLHELNKELDDELDAAEPVTADPGILQEDAYTENSETYDITFIELAMLNRYFHSVYRKSIPPLKVFSYGYTDSVGRVSFGGAFDPTQSFWFNCRFDGEEQDYIFHTKIMTDNRNEMICQLHISVKKGVIDSELEKIFKRIRTLAFNNSEYAGKCIKVRLKENLFRGIEIIEFKKGQTQLIMSDIQSKYIKHFISRVKRGSTARYLLNGEPGTGKTAAIREVILALIPNVTFIIPDFTTTQDLTVILEACAIFENAVIIMDDIDLYLGSRDNGSYTRLLGEFLAFFDGVKERKISLLASTNDKGLVDKAAERPGRFNMTLDYTFLTSEQIVKVCQIHLPEQYHLQEVYDVLQGTIDGKQAKITGAFIANLADNIREMSEDEDIWEIKDTLSLIKESYKGFYSSQVDKNKERVGFKTSY